MTEPNLIRDAILQEMDAKGISAYQLGQMAGVPENHLSEVLRRDFGIRTADKLLRALRIRVVRPRRRRRVTP